MTDLYKNKAFAEVADSAGLTDDDLCKAAKLTLEYLKAGNARGKVGKNLYKVRVARPGAGKSGGARTVLTTAVGKDVFFIYCYPKNAVSAKGGGPEISKSTVESLEEQASLFLGFNAERLTKALETGIIIKVECNGLC